VKKTQFVSPIIILIIIIISTILITVQTLINSELQKNTQEYAKIINDIEDLTLLDLNYQNNLTNKLLQLASTINNSGTIESIIDVKNIQFTNEIILEYSKQQRIGTSSKTFNNKIIVPYPYNSMLEQEERFNPLSFASCMGGTCTSFESCVDAYDTGTIDWEPVTCLTNPLRIKIRVKNSEHPLTIDYPYNLWNNTILIIG
jgi:hypothetical protein